MLTRRRATQLLPAVLLVTVALIGVNQPPALAEAIFDAIVDEGALNTVISP